MSSELVSLEEFKRGQWGERIAALIFSNRGWFVIPSYEYSGPENDKAPKMRRHGEAYALPDLDISRDGERHWVEVKTKGRANPWRRENGRPYHGLSTRLWDDYREVQRQTGCKVFLVIVEECTGDVLFQSLDELEKVRQEHVGEAIRGERLVFFPRDAFRLLANVAELELAA